MSRYSKKTREQAARICAIAASNDELSQNYGAVANNLGKEAPIAALEFALDAWAAVRGCDNHSQHPDAEAEALLRSGWNPGEETERR